jgi:hypothetical protein
MIIIEDWNNDRELRLMFCSTWRGFDPTDDLELTAIADRGIGASSEHMGKRLTKLQRCPRIFRGDMVKSPTAGRFSLSLSGAAPCSLLAVLESIFA